MVHQASSKTIAMPGWAQWLQKSPRPIKSAKITFVIDVSLSTDDIPLYRERINSTIGNVQARFPRIPAGITTFSSIVKTTEYEELSECLKYDEEDWDLLIGGGTLLRDAVKGVYERAREEWEDEGIFPIIWILTDGVDLGSTSDSEAVRNAKSLLDKALGIEATVALSGFPVPGLNVTVEEYGSELGVSSKRCKVVPSDSVASMTTSMAQAIDEIFDFIKLAIRGVKLGEKAQEKLRDDVPSSPQVDEEGSDLAGKMGPDANEFLKELFNASYQTRS